MAVSVVSFSQTTWNDTTTPKTHTGQAWSAGDVIVVAGGIESADLTLSTPTNANLTFNLQASITTNGAGDAAAYLWTATAATPQTGQTISCTRGVTGGHWGTGCWVFTGTSGSVANATADRTEATITITPTAGSGVVYFIADWAANATDQTQSTSTGTRTERADSNSAQWAWYAGEWVDVTAGSTAFGVTSYAGIQLGHVLIEILASAAAAAADGSPLVMGLPGLIGPDGKVFTPGRRFDDGAAAAEVVPASLTPYRSPYPRILAG